MELFRQIIITFDCFLWIDCEFSRIYAKWFTRIQLAFLWNSYNWSTIFSIIQNRNKTELIWDGKKSFSAKNSLHRYTVFWHKQKMFILVKLPQIWRGDNHASKLAKCKQPQPFSFPSMQKYSTVFLLLH